MRKLNEYAPVEQILRNNIQQQQENELGKKAKLNTNQRVYVARQLEFDFFCIHRQMRH